MSAFLALTGCATKPVEPDPALFPRSTSPAQGPVGGRLALVIGPEVASSVGQWKRPLLSDVPAPSVPIGRIVERAGQEVLASDATGAGPGLTLVVDSASCVLEGHVRWLLPVPFVGVIGDSSTDVRVMMALRLLDEEGRTLLERIYDSGRQVLPSQYGGREGPGQAVVRLAHEGAWQLWLQAAADLRHWLAAERARPREL
jgi:hypothetical protein